jgi:Fe2+ transport system protein FeoA
MTDVQGQVDRLEAWVDGSAICVIAVSALGDPLDLGEDEVEAFIEQLRACVVKVRGA